MGSSSHHRLKQLANKYENKEVVVVGNGPSLSKTPLNGLSSQCTFAMNGINHIYEAVDWRPDFYAFLKSCINDEEKEMIKENIELGCICFLNIKYCDIFGEKENVYYIKRRKLRRDPLTLASDKGQNIDKINVECLSEYWSDDITMGVYKQHTMYAVMQIVSYMGFNEIYLIGCDLGFDIQKPYMVCDTGLDPTNYEKNIQLFFQESLKNNVLFESIINGVALKILQSQLVYNVLKRKTDLFDNSSHFTEEYDNKIRFADVNTEITNSHKVAKKILSDQNTSVYNATLGGELEVYPRKNIESVLDE